MLENNWYVIDKFQYGDNLPIVNILEAFMDSVKKRILFSFYFFSLDDLKEDSDYTKDDCINDGFNEFKIIADPSNNSIKDDELVDKVINMLSMEYSRITKKECNEATRKDLLGRLLEEKLNFFSKSYIHFIKEFITREVYKPNKDRKEFIDQRSICTNNTDVSFVESRLYGKKADANMEYVWYGPKSGEKIDEIVKINDYSFKCIITEDIYDFNNYLYAFELFEQADFALAVNDRVGNFESIYIPKIKPLLRKENIIYNENEYIKALDKRL